MNHPTIFIAALCALVAVSILHGCGGAPMPGATASAPDRHDTEAPDAHPTETRIVAATAEEVGIRTARVGPGIIRDAHDVQGLLAPREGRHARIRARFPGPIREVRVRVGDRVRRGQVLALVESNASLSTYEIVAPFDGTILDADAGAGDLAAEQPLFELADLSSLWVDLHLFGEDAQHITPGLPVDVFRLSDGSRASTRLDRVLPGTATASQSTVARATIANTDGRWRPGTAVRARVTVAEQPAALVVPLAALQSLEGNSVVFVHSADRYAARIVTLGSRDSDSAEIKAGLEAGEDIVVAQSYLIKADLEKASAAHED